MPIGDLLAQITGDSSTAQPSPATRPLPPKRKADNHLVKEVDHGARNTVGSLRANLSKPMSSLEKKPALISTPLTAIKLSSSTRPALASPVRREKISQPPPSVTPQKPPKKGSFAEILARGKAAHATLGQVVGKIQHKRIEKPLSKREREEAKIQRAQKLEKNLAPGSKFRKDVGKTQVRNGVANNLGKANGKNKATAVEPVKKPKKSVPSSTGYTGTARPGPAGSKSSSRTSGPDFSSRYDRGREERRRSTGAHYQYLSEEDEEDDEIGDEQDGYASDASSNMEAALYEVDEEEETAEKIAKREDAEALKEENKLKREKEEKRKRLAMMAKSRAGRSY